VALFGGEEGSLDWNHFFRVDSNLCKFLPDGQGSIVILGAAEESIRKISKYYPSVEITPFYLRDKKSWGATIKKNKLKNKFDCLFAMDILEKETDKEGLLHLLHSLLKTNGRAVINTNPFDKNSFYDQIENFIKNSKWDQLIKVNTGLSIPECRRLIEKEGFSILREDASRYFIVYSSPFDFKQNAGDWICNRLDIPLPYRKEFVSELKDSLIIDQMFVLQMLPVYSFVVEKR
jgi:hypothetical protein